MALALGQCLPLRSWRQERSSEPRVGEAAKCVAVRGTTTLGEERPPTWPNCTSDSGGGGLGSCRWAVSRLLEN